MDIVEMHKWIRQYAQQMGMQNIRALTPEQIDMLINTSIDDSVNQLIKENIAATISQNTVNNSKIGQINALSTLYNVAYIDMSPKTPTTIETRAFDFNAYDRVGGKMSTTFNKMSNERIIPEYLYIVDLSINYKKVKDNLGYTGSYGSYSVLTPEGAIRGTNDYLVSVTSINEVVQVEVYSHIIEDFKVFNFKVYKDNGTFKLVCIDADYTDYYLGVEGINDVDSQYGGKHYQLTKTFTTSNQYNSGIMYNPLVVHNEGIYIEPSFTNELETKYFPVRIIEDNLLANTLNDFVLKNKLVSPIIVAHNNNFDLYLDDFVEKRLNDNSIRYVLKHDLLPYKLRMSYIRKPAVVKYVGNQDSNNIDCDLPEYMHIPILKHAVDLYRIVVSGALYGGQTQNNQNTNSNNNIR